jgi:DNA polymerase-3 subunit epsilon
LQPDATFVALDFELANPSLASVCALALARVERLQIVDRALYLVRPPNAHFTFSALHGITWESVCAQPSFAEIWPKTSLFLDGVDFLASHNVAFDGDVLYTGCRLAGLAMPKVPLRCTMRLARMIWEIYPTTLPDVCRFLNLPLQHHDPLADAEACAQIVIHAVRAACQTSHEKS